MKRDPKTDQFLPGDPIKKLAAVDVALLARECDSPGWPSILAAARRRAKHVLRAVELYLAGTNGHHGDGV